MVVAAVVAGLPLEFKEALIVKPVLTATAVVVIVKLAEVALAATVIVAGTIADGLLLNK